MYFDIVGIGNPLLDLTVNVSEDFLLGHGLKKGTMTLVESDFQKRILESINLDLVVHNPGGSVSNTLAAAASLGGKTLFLGSIGKDVFGDSYESLIVSSGISSGLVKSSNPQGTCLVLVTPDGERTFATFLGACLDFNLSSLDVEALKSAKVLHIEAYQLDGEEQQKVVFEALKIAKENNVLISLDLADPFLIKRHRHVLKKLLSEYIDVVFANELEAETFTGMKPLDALKEFSHYCKIAFVKLGEKGSIVMFENNFYSIDGFKVKVVNTNGAGDTFAGAFLQSYITGKSILEAGKIASFLAAEVVKSENSRLTGDITSVVKKFF